VSDRKTERLINLTLALLSAKRYLKKNQILENVSGYEGTQEAKERMFERDKDDLRSLGIEIEVGDLDIFFEDEPGYRIPQKSYELTVPNLTPRELAIISIAANLWNDSAFAPNAQSGIRKLQSLGVPASLDLDFKLKYRFENPSILLDGLTKAISNRCSISYSYDSQSLKERRVNPYRILFWNDFWYLIGFDLDRNEIRLFKLSRIVSEITAAKKKKTFEIPQDFDPKQYLPKSNREVAHIAKVAIDKDMALILRNRGKLIEEGPESDIFEFVYTNEPSFMRELIWHGSSVKVIEPKSLSQSLLQLLSKVSK
jgi:proteasome accessory factor B